jgi:translation elongation factor P/translation initiation factor 5A
MNATINNLKNGQSVKISGDSAVWVTVEKSGNGKIIRWVRNTPNSSEVFKTVSL